MTYSLMQLLPDSILFLAELFSNKDLKDVVAWSLLAIDMMTNASVQTTEAIVEVIHSSDYQLVEPLLISLSIFHGMVWLTPVKLNKLSNFGLPIIPWMKAAKIFALNQPFFNLH